MSEVVAHDTVAALAEADASGATAEIFADIRKTMRIPLLTSIWRILADSEEDLASTWNAVKPLYETQQPETALARLRSEAEFPVLEPIQANELADTGVSGHDLLVIKAIMAAYNRSNSLNLLTQTAIVIDPTESYVAYQQTPVADDIPIPPKLPSRDEIDDQVWASILAINQYGTPEENPGLATFYRHLAYWPGLLDLMNSKLADAEKNGSIEDCAANVFGVAREEGARLAHLRDDSLVDAISEPAMSLVANYVGSLHNVTRIVSIGTALRRWLDSAP